MTCCDPWGGDGSAVFSDAEGVVVGWLDQGAVVGAAEMAGAVVTTVASSPLVAVLPVSGVAGWVLDRNEGSWVDKVDCARGSSSWVLVTGALARAESVSRLESALSPGEQATRPSRNTAQSVPKYPAIFIEYASVAGGPAVCKSLTIFLAITTII